MGYKPEIGIVLHDVEVEEKEAALKSHSEKLAITFSLIHSKILFIRKQVFQERS